MQNDAAMLRLEHFKRSLDQVTPSSNSMDIKTEIALLVEVEEICDELELLEKVLEDQKKTVTEMSGIIATQSKTEWTGTRVTTLHEQRVDRMVHMAASTKESVSTGISSSGVHHVFKGYDPAPITE
jgi:hypothetical protein